MMDIWKSGLDVFGGEIGARLELGETYRQGIWTGHEVS